MISGHAYRPNGLSASDENGDVTCAQCGHPEQVHRSSLTGRMDAALAKLNEELGDRLPDGMHFAWAPVDLGSHWVLGPALSPVCELGHRLAILDGTHVDPAEAALHRGH